MMQKAETPVCDWSDFAQSHRLQIYKEFSSGGVFIRLVPLYSLMVAEEELMNVAESPRRTGGDQTREEER